MSIGQAVRKYRDSKNISQEELARSTHYDRSALGRVEREEQTSSPELDLMLSRMNWRLALAVADERTGGYIGNLLDDQPNLDLHPAALKELLAKEMLELKIAMEGLLMVRHLDPKKSRQSAERIWHEIRDVQKVALVLLGVVEEEFGLDRERMIIKHEMEMKSEER